ncbi:JAB domain-containing protein [Lichenicoccus sp.]|uniref:JAB domain-containing protein n=1 Tax=Lichenicoccus sp. TaxID=2781899 RepID=UPI003D0D92FC
MVWGFSEAGGFPLSGLLRRGVPPARVLPALARPARQDEGSPAPLDRPFPVFVAKPVLPAPPGHNREAPFASTGPQGHRRRMRERLLAHGGAALADYEVLEMLLFLGIARRDTKPLAKALINSFGSLAAVLSASPEALQRQGGLAPDCAALLRLPELAAHRLSRAEARDHPILNNWERLHGYFETALTGAIPGQLRVLFLDNRNRLLADEAVAEAPAPGEEDSVRAIMRHALGLHATALVVVRIVPPRAIAKSVLEREAELSRQLSRASGPLAIIVHDHMLVGGENWVSLKQKGLI